MSFRDLRNARTSRQTKKSFVVPHITDVRAWRSSIESQSPNEPQEQVKQEQLIWTVRNEEEDGRLEEEDELAYDENTKRIEQDDIKEKEEDVLPEPQLESTQLKQKHEIKNATPRNEKLETVSNTEPTDIPPKTSSIHIAQTTGVPKNSVSSEPSTSVSSRLYSGKPPTIEIKLSEKRGRGLWTTEFIKAGTTIFTIRPHVHVLSRTQLDLFCSTCARARSTTGLKRCGRCKVSHYCDAKCQNADWTMHKIECDALQRWAASAPSTSAGIVTSSAETQDRSDDEDRDGTGKDDQRGAEEYTPVPSEAIRCLARILWKRKKEGSNSIWWKEINEMQSHRNNIAQSMINAHVHLAHGIVRYMGLENAHDLAKYEVLGVGELVELISKFTSNSFTLATPSLSPIGVAISPLAALINHSCDPNVAIVFPRFSTTQQEPMIHAVAIQDIRPNTELFTSYIDVTLPGTLRQKDLKETYSFTCECEVCKPPSVPGVTQADDWRERLWCPKQCGGTCSKPSTDDDVVQCSKCRTRVVDVPKVMDNIRVGQDALDKANSLQSSDLERALKLTRNTIPLLIRSGLPPSSHPLLALYRLQQGLLISSFSSTPKLSKELLDEAISTAAKAAAGLENVLRPGHPVRALAFTELGKLLAVDEPGESSNTKALLNETVFPPSGPARLQLAIQALRRAHTELDVAFGKAGEDDSGGAVGREVRELLVNLEKEMGIWSKRIGATLKDVLAEQKAVGTRTTN